MQLFLFRRKKTKTNFIAPNGSSVLIMPRKVLNSSYPQPNMEIEEQIQATGKAELHWKL